LSPFLAFLVFLVPLAVYFLVLGLINRRLRPLIVSGPWDFAGLLFAVSGFLFFGGPSMLTWLNDRWQLAQLLDPRRGHTGNQGYYVWLTLWAVYFLVVVGGSALVLWRRRSQLSIYNVEPAAFDDALAQALDRLGLSWSRSGQQLCIGFAGTPGNGGRGIHRPIATGWSAGEMPRRTSFGSAEEGGSPAARIELDASPSMRHVTVFFNQVDAGLRQEIEAELAQVLSRVYTHSNPAGAWFLLIAALLFGLMFFLALVVIVILPTLAVGG
jgi:hypothetical protein